jgi:hypothetical protein
MGTGFPAPIAAVLAFCGVVTLSSAASAFKPEGHEAIEALAYRELAQTARQQICREPDDAVTGVDVLRLLVNVGVLETPACYEVQPGSYAAEACGLADAASWPRLGSGAPDNLFARQFGGEGQCFHFMAETSDVTGTENGPVPGIRRGLSHVAYRRCMQTVNDLWLELLGAPAGSRNAGRGMYALMHSVEDSFSAAHTERDALGRIVYLRAWDLLSPLSYLGNSGWSYLGTERQHQVSDERDEAWRSGEVSPRCPANGDPYVLAQTDACYSPRAREAAEAVVELLKVTYCAFRQEHLPAMWSPGNGPRGRVTQDVRDRWNRFVRTYLASSVAQPVELPPSDPLPTAVHHERTPEMLLGSRTTIGAGSGQGRVELGATLQGFPPLRNTYPFVPLWGIDAGVRLQPKGRFGGGNLTLLGTMLPLADSFALTLEAAAVEAYWNTQGGDAQVDVLSSLRADFFSRQGYWIALTVPRWAWLSREWRHEGGVTVGYAWDLNSVASLGDSGYLNGGANWSFREFSPPGVTERDATRARKPVAIGSFGIQPDAPPGGYGVRAVFPELLYTPAWLGEAFDFGGAVIGATTRDSKGGDTTIGLAARARFYLLPKSRWVGVGLTPLEVDIGDMGVPSAIYVNATTWGHLMLRLFDVFEIAGDVPVITWYDARQRSVVPWFLRFGWVQGL